MTVARLVSVCGLCVAFSGLAAAQPQTPPKSEPGKSEPGKSQPDKSQPGKTDPARPSSATSDQNSLLKQMEGHWKVEVAIDPTLWNPQLFRDDTKPSDSSKPSPASKPSDPSKPSSTTPGATPGQDSADLTKTVTGYSNVRLILGDHVLQETTVMPDMKAKMSRPSTTGDKTDDKTDDKNARSGKKTGDSAFKGVSLFSFDENNKTYSMAFVDNCDGGMHYCTGTYDASGSRIVFNSSDHAGHNPSSPSTRTPGTDSTPGSESGKLQGMSNMQVVVEIVSPDEHRVTMYANAMPMSGEPGRYSEPSRTSAPKTSPTDPATGQPRTDDRTNDRTNDRSTDRTNTPSSNYAAGGKIVYRAIYRRASGDEAQRVREALRVSDANSDR